MAPASSRRPEELAEFGARAKAAGSRFPQRFLAPLQQAGMAGARRDARHCRLGEAAHRPADHHHRQRRPSTRISSPTCSTARIPACVSPPISPNWSRRFEAGEFDMVGVGRMQIANADFVTKLRRGPDRRAAALQQGRPISGISWRRSCRARSRSIARRRTSDLGRAAQIHVFAVSRYSACASIGLSRPGRRLPLLWSFRKAVMKKGSARPGVQTMARSLTIAGIAAVTRIGAGLIARAPALRGSAAQLLSPVWRGHHPADQPLARGAAEQCRPRQERAHHHWPSRRAWWYRADRRHGWC